MSRIAGRYPRTTPMSMDDSGTERPAPRLAGALTPLDRRHAIRELARQVGFNRCGCAPAKRIDRADYYQQWLAAGRAGTMAYMHRHAAMRVDASVLLPYAKSVVVCAISYHQPAPPAADEASSSPRGRVAMYAWGDDYHRLLKAKLFKMLDGMRRTFDEPFEAKVCVDTAPLIEREYALRSGVGWIGKNTLVLNEQMGSYLFLGEIVTTLELAPDEPAVDHCGNCTRCLDACPTAAFPHPYQMNAARCISYLTIEHRAEAIPVEFQDPVGRWVFGCDVCQQVCPYNKDAAYTREPGFAVRPPGPAPRLDELVDWDDDRYRQVLRRSAIKRAKPAMLRRNARLALRNAGGAPPVSGGAAP